MKTIDLRINFKKMYKIINILLTAFLVASMAGCTMFGLDLQEDFNRNTHALSPYLGKTAWDYMKSRNYITVTDTIINTTADTTIKTVDTVKINSVSTLQLTYTNYALAKTASEPNFPVTATVKFGKVISVDTIFSAMLRGVAYSGIDTNEYMKAGRTFVILHNDAIKRINTAKGADLGKPYSDCFFGAVLVNNKVAANWSDYKSPEFVKKYLEYLILMGKFSHYTLSDIGDSIVNTLLTNDSPLYFQHLPLGITQPGGIPVGSSSSGSVPAFIDGGNGAKPAYGSNNGTQYIQILNWSPSNTSDYPIQLNDYLNVRTSDLIANGYDEQGNLVPNSVYIQVIDRFLITNLPH